MSSEPIQGTSPGVQAFLGEGYPRVARFAKMLTSEGVQRGLIGPREVLRLWERHLLNSAAIASFLPEEGTVVDVGSGAGLPGIVLACVRPDLHIVLLEPMERRTAWLAEVVKELDLASVEVLRARAENVHGSIGAMAVTARAVAPMDRLARWTLPLLKVGGVLVAMKGEQAATEVGTATAVIAELGGGAAQIYVATTVDGVAPTTVVKIIKERDPHAVTQRHQGTRSRAIRRGR